MTPLTEQEVEAALMNAAQYTLYPPTPDIASKVTRRLSRRSPVPALARAAAVLLVLFAALFVAVPEIRAAVLSALRFGAVTLVRETPTPEPQPSGDVVPSVLELNNETTLDAVRGSFPYPIALPSYPPDLGLPDRVFEPTPQSIVFVWMDGEDIRLVLTIHHKDQYLSKYYPHAEIVTRVNGMVALWLEEPHTLFEDGGRIVIRRIIHDHVLLWTVGDLTYRLETDLSEDDAIAIAESIDVLDFAP